MGLAVEAGLLHGLRADYRAARIRRWSHSAVRGRFPVQEAARCPDGSAASRAYAASYKRDLKPQAPVPASLNAGNTGRADRRLRAPADWQGCTAQQRAQIIHSGCI
jgi:hypothetical protein